MHTGYLTTYNHNGKDYASYILGSDLNYIKAICEKRGLNESIESGVMNIAPIPDYRLLSNYEFIIKLPEILHTACYLAFVAMKAQTATVEDILGDDGILHELSHLLSGSVSITDKTIFDIRNKFRKLQDMAIGLY